MIDRRSLFAYIGGASILGAFIFWEYLPKGSFYKFDAIAWVFILLSFHMYTKGCINIFIEYLCVGSINNLIDELGVWGLFSYDVFSYSEMILFIIATIIYSRKLYICLKSKSGNY